jgi:hypothetical protein
MVPPRNLRSFFKQDFSCPVLLFERLHTIVISHTGLSPSIAGLSRPFCYNASACHVQAFSLSLATTREISVDFFSCRYLDVSVPYVRFSEPMYSVRDDRISPAGFPHSDTSGSMLVASSPELFAGCHVFHRLLLPRHSPCALNFLTI